MLEELRFRHHWILGQTRTGKTTLLIQSAVEDMEAGHGVLFIDPHNNDELLKQIPEDRHKDTIIFDVSDEEYPVAWNPLQQGDAYTASIFTETLKAIWGYSEISTPQMDQTIYNATVAMLDKSDGTLLGMLFMLTNAAYRDRVYHDLNDPVVLSFWRDFDDLSAKDQRELTRSTLNKIQMLVADPRIRNIVSQPSSAFSLKDIMDQKKILIVRLPLQHFGEQKVGTLGGLILSQVYHEIAKNTEPFHLYVDDVQYFQTPILKSLLASAGRYQVSLNFTSQYLSQLKPDILHAFLGNIGRKTAFRLGISDSEVLSDDFAIRSAEIGLHELLPYHAWLITPTGTKLKDLTQELADLVDTSENLVRISRRGCASQRKHVEPKIAKFIEGMK